MSLALYSGRLHRPSVEQFLASWRPTGALREERQMQWTKPEFAVVAVTMEVTAYAATK